MLRHLEKDLIKGVKKKYFITIARPFEYSIFSNILNRKVNKWSVTI